jgi:hypothetical protein
VGLSDQRVPEGLQSPSCQKCPFCPPGPGYAEKFRPKLCKRG